jgi:hypothetical protein
VENIYDDREQLREDSEAKQVIGRVEDLTMQATPSAVETQHAAYENTRKAAAEEYVRALRDGTNDVTPETIELTKEETAPEHPVDQSSEADERLQTLRLEGHGPQRHHDPTDEQLAARVGTPKIDASTGEFVRKANGLVASENHIDPMTGTTTDGVLGGVHKCGDYATRFDTAEDFVAADRYMRQIASDNGEAAVRAPISEVLGPDAHERLTGVLHDPDNPAQLRSVDFQDGTIVAIYQRDAGRALTLYTMYPDPVPYTPSQSGSDQ